MTQLTACIQTSSVIHNLPNVYNCVSCVYTCNTDNLYISDNKEVFSLNQNLPSLNDFINSEPRVTSFKEVKEYLPTKTFSSFVKEYENSSTWTKEIVYVNGVHFKGGRQRFLFKLSEAMKLKNAKSLRDAAKIVGVDRNTLNDWKQKGLLDEGLIGEKWVDVDWLSEVLPTIIDGNKKNNPLFVNQDKYELIKKNGGEHLCNLIDSFINARINGHGFSVSGTIKYNKKMDKPEKNAPELKTRLITIIYGIVCNRSGIKGWFGSEIGPRYRNLSQDEIDKFDASLFNVWDITKSDIESLCSNWSDVTQVRQLNSYLKPFLYFVLSELKSQKRMFRVSSLSRTSDTKSKEIDELALKIELFEEGLEEILPLFPSGRVIHEVKQKRLEDDEGDDYRFSRGDIVKMIEGFKYVNVFEPLKRRAVLLFAVGSGLRPNEMANVKLKDLVLNDQFLLQGFTYNDSAEFKQTKFYPMVKTDIFDDIQGGILKVKYSKGSYSNSPHYGNYLPLFTLQALNLYLDWAFAKNPEMKNKNAYLFPKSINYPFTPYQNHKIGKFVSDHRNTLFSFLETESRSNITLYNFRKTVADWIIYKTNIQDPLLSEKKVAAGQVHLRHDSSKHTKDNPLILSNYAGKVSSEEYFDIMIKALNFPITAKELEQWEIQNGLKVVNRTEKSEKDIVIRAEIELTDEEKLSIDKYKKSLEGKERMYETIKNGWRNSFTRIYGITRDDFLTGNLIDELKDEIQELKEKIREIKVG